MAVAIGLREGPRGSAKMEGMQSSAAGVEDPAHRVHCENDRSPLGD